MTNMINNAYCGYWYPNQRCDGLLDAGSLQTIGLVTAVGTVVALSIFLEEKEPRVTSNKRRMIRAEDQERTCLKRLVHKIRNDIFAPFWGNKNHSDAKSGKNSQQSPSTHLSLKCRSFQKTLPPILLPSDKK